MVLRPHTHMAYRIINNTIVKNKLLFSSRLHSNFNYHSTRLRILNIRTIRSSERAHTHTMTMVFFVFSPFIGNALILFQWEMDFSLGPIHSARPHLLPSLPSSRHRIALLDAFSKCLAYTTSFPVHQSQYPAFLFTVEQSASWVHFALALDTLSTSALVVHHAQWQLFNALHPCGETLSLPADCSFVVRPMVH